MHRKKHHFFNSSAKYNREINKDFKWEYRYLRFARPLILFFNLLLIYLIIKGTGIKTFSILVVLVITFHLTKELLHYFYLFHFEKKIIKPLDNLKKGVEQVAQGNYNVTLEYEEKNEVGSLIDSFNKMAKKLEENERLKREYEENRKALITNISHDLRTPLTSINGYVEGMIDGVIEPGDYNKSLNIIREETIRLSRLTSEILQLAKMQSGYIKLKKENIVPLINPDADEYYTITPLYIRRLDSTLLERSGGKIIKDNILLIGCGSIGSNILFMLFKVNIT